MQAYSLFAVFRQMFFCAFAVSHQIWWQMPGNKRGKDHPSSLRNLPKVIFAIKGVVSQIVVKKCQLVLIKPLFFELPPPAFC